MLTPSTMICPILVTTCEAYSKSRQEHPSLLWADDLEPGRGLSDAGEGQRQAAMGYWAGMAGVGGL
jgi:hypothetical protein